MSMTLAAAALIAASFAGSPAAASSGGAGMTPPPSTRVAAPTGPVLSPVAGIPQLSAGLVLRKVGGRAVSAAAVTYVSQAEEPLHVRVDVVRLADGLSIFHDERTVGAGEPTTVRWAGRAGAGVAPDGRYELRIALGDATAARRAASTGTPGGGASPDDALPPPGSTALGRFAFVGTVFPVRGEHVFGEGAGRYGAGRGGRSHEGQDVMAACGTPLVAARGGVVTMRAQQWAAGNYVVIHDPVSKLDYMYAHLRGRAIVRRGQRVETGQPIGVVGDTGDASVCHLHIELWTAPGWYAGGRPIDPLPALKRWDRLS